MTKIFFLCPWCQWKEWLLSLSWEPFCKSPPPPPVLGGSGDAPPPPSESPTSPVLAKATTKRMCKSQTLPTTHIINFPVSRSMKSDEIQSYLECLCCATGVPQGCHGHCRLQPKQKLPKENMTRKCYPKNLANLTHLLFLSLHTPVCSAFFLCYGWSCCSKSCGRYIQDQTCNSSRRVISKSTIRGPIQFTTGLHCSLLGCFLGRGDTAALSVWFFDCTKVFGTEYARDGCCPGLQLQNQWWDTDCCIA